MDQATSLVSPNFIGRDKFNWWVGQVEKSVDTSKNSNRVKVRIVGYHSDRKNIKAEDLPWAQILYPPTNSQMSGQGKKVMLLPGQWCLGFFLDGDDQQIPIVWGLLGGTVNTDDKSQVSPESFSSPENIWGKPDYVEPNNKAKAPNVPSADKTNDQPHLAPKADPPSANGKSKDDLDSSSKPKPKSLATDPLASKADKDQQEKESYKVAVGDGVCNTESMMGQMAAKLEEFTKGLDRVTKAGDKWIDEQTGKIVDVQNKVNDYSTMISEMLKNPLSAIIRYLQNEIREKYPEIYGASANPDPFTLMGLKKSLDEALNTIKCIMESGVLDTLFPMLKDKLQGILDQVVNAPTKYLKLANCSIRKAMGDILVSALDSVTEGLNIVADLLKAVFADLGSLLGSINGMISSVIGFAKQLLGFLGCFDKDIDACVRSNVFDTKQGNMRPMKLSIPSFGGTQTGQALESAKKFMQNPISSDTLAEDGCSDPNIDTYAPDNRQTCIASSLSPGLKDSLDAFTDWNEEIEGFICHTVIDDVINGSLDITAVIEQAVASGRLALPSVFANASSVEAALAAGGGNSEQAYYAASLLSQLGILNQYNDCTTGEGPSYGIEGYALGYNSTTKEVLIGNLDAPLIDGTWVRYKRDKRKNMKIGTSRFIPKSEESGGSGAWIELPIDFDGYPAQDGIVYDGGSGYGNGANGKCAPDLFIVTEMYDPTTGLPVDGYYLKGTAFVNEYGEIVATSFNNENGYVFREKPIVSVNECGGDFKQPDSRNAVEDPNTLTNQTDTTVVISAENTNISGIIQEVRITNVGEGYRNPICYLDGGCNGFGAVVECEHKDGRIINIKVIDSGQNYNCIPNVIISDLPVPGQKFGRGAEAVAVIRYVPVTDRSFQEKIAQQETVEVVDCP